MEAFAICFGYFSFIVCGFSLFVERFSYAFADWLIIIDTGKQITCNKQVLKTMHNVVCLKDEVILCGSKLPYALAAIYWIMYLCKKLSHTKRQMSVEELCKIFSEEPCDTWIILNGYPLHKNSWEFLKLRYFKNKFKVFCKQRKYLKFNRTGRQENLQRFNDSITIEAFVIITKDTEYQPKLDQKYKAKNDG